MNWRLLLPLLPLLLLLCGDVFARDGARESLQSLQQRIEFQSDTLPPSAQPSPHSESAQITATISGHQTIEYLIDARTGQSLELNLLSSNSQAGYRITAPAAPRALHRGQGPHSRFSVTLPRDGTYRVLIYLSHGAANNGERADFALDIRLRNPG